jgi:putative drug exporter of the RND superfamily
MFDMLAVLVDRRGWLIVLAWMAFLAFLFFTAPDWDAVTRDDDVRFFPPGYPSVVGQELLERGFPHDSASSSTVVILERRDGHLQDADFAYADKLVNALDALRRARTELGIRQIVNFRSPVVGKRLIGTALDGRGQAVLTNVSIQGTYLAKQTRLTVDEIQKTLDGLEQPPPGLARSITGSAVVGHDMNQASIVSINNTTYSTIALVIVILLFVYRSPLLALLPFLTIALSVCASLMAITLLTKIPFLNFRVINITNIFVIVVLFGAGTDYCLFLIARYREELARGRSSSAALSEAIRQVGGALVASAGTVICGLGMLWFSSFAKIQYTGPAIALSLAIGLLASLTLAPVLLHWLRGTVFWPFKPPHHVAGADREAESLAEIPMSKFWYKVSDAIVRRPMAILIVSLVALAPFAILGMRVKSSYSQIGDLRGDQPCVIGAEAIKRYFPVGELSPSHVLIAHPRVDFLTNEGRKAIDVVSRSLAQFPNVAEVRSVSQPLGKPEPLPTPAQVEAPAPAGAANKLSGFLNRFRSQGFQAVADELGQKVREIEDSHYVSTQVKGADKNHVTRITLVFKTDPFAPESLDSLAALRKRVVELTSPGQVLAGASAVGLTGASAALDDLRRVTTSDERRMYVLVTLGVYAILVVLLRRPGICLYLIATVVLGYLASLGLTEIVFKWLHHGPEPWQGLDWKVGFFLFVILVAVGEDYNIFLMSRVIEEERKHGAIEGTRLAVAHTGGIISSCGLIMAGTFFSMAAASLTALQELGFALGMGVLLDTFVVRPILVPAFLVLLHRNRWVPLAHIQTEPAPVGQEEPAATTSAS